MNSPTLLRTGRISKRDKVRLGTASCKAGLYEHGASATVPGFRRDGAREVSSWMAGARALSGRVLRCFTPVRPDGGGVVRTGRRRWRRRR